MNVGSVNLSSASVVAVSNYDYYKTDGGEIIGGVQTIKITGAIVVEDTPGSPTGQMVMAKLREIVNLGKEPKCVTVNVPGYFGQAKIDNVTTSQGSDPTWINKADFSIELKAPLANIPSNSFGIVASDSVTQISRSEKVEFPEDHHGYVYNGSFHKTYAVGVTDLNVVCEPICQPGFSLVGVFNKLNNNSLTIGPVASWNRFAKSRSVQVNANSFIINTQYIATPHEALAFVDLFFSHSQTYGDNPSSKKIISGTITGLTDVGIFNQDGFSETCSASKLANAESAFGKIKSKFMHISSWEGIELELTKFTNPFVSSSSCTNTPTTPINQKPCLKPSLSTVAKSRTDGTIDFTFEWSTDPDGNCADSESRISTDVTVDIIEPQIQYVEFVIPSFGTLIQNLNTRNARRINVQTVVTYPQDICGQSVSSCGDDDINEILSKYNINGILIKDTITTAKRSVTRDRTYLEC